MAEKKLRAVKGGRVTLHKRRGGKVARRIVFVPREGGGIDVLDAENYMALRLAVAVEITVDTEAVLGYEPVDG